MVERMALKRTMAIWPMKKIKVLAWTLGLLVVVGSACVLYARRQGRVSSQQRLTSENDSWRRSHPPVSPVDYPSRSWKSRYGGKEPDTRTPEGKRALDAERERLPRALAEFRRLLDGLPSAALGPDTSGVPAPSSSVIRNGLMGKIDE